MCDEFIFISILYINSLLMLSELLLFWRKPKQKDNPGTSGSIPESELTNQTAAASEPTNNTQPRASNITQSEPVNTSTSPEPAKKKVRVFSYGFCFIFCHNLL